RCARRRRSGVGLRQRNEPCAAGTRARRTAGSPKNSRKNLSSDRCWICAPVSQRDRVAFATSRSEERRVGKECRPQRTPEGSSRRRHTRLQGDWSSDVCSSDLPLRPAAQVRSWSETAKRALRSRDKGAPHRGKPEEQPQELVQRPLLDLRPRLPARQGCLRHL